VDGTSSNNPTSPLSAVSGSLSVLSSEESKIAEEYKTMLKLKVPKDAVKHKMEKDQVDPKIMGFVLGEDTLMSSNGSTCSQLSAKEEKVAALYKRMLKLMIPPEAVRHKMEKEGVDDKIVFAVLGQDQVEQNALEHAATQLSGAEQAIAESYKKMMKMMIPKEAVEHKMHKDQVDPRIIMIVIGAPPNSNGSGAGNGEKPLSDEEESIASKYRQMLKLQLPREAVKHKMQKEGVPERIIAAVLGEKKSMKNESTKAAPPLPRRSIKPGFHWDPLPSGEQLENSIWAKKKPKVEIEKPEAIDISKHIEAFQKKPNASGIPAKKVNNSTDKKDTAKLIDLNRANNVAISLRAFKDFSNKELSHIIEYIDPFEKIKGDRALFIRDLLPSGIEVKAIKTYTGEDHRLVSAEKWFKQIVHVSRVEEKVQVLRTIETFKREASALGESFKLLTNVCNQVIGSEKLPDLLEMVRQIGNRMNEGRGEDAAGFKLDFLPRLAQTKGSDRKTTALDLVVMIFVARNQREALMLTSDFPECQAASRIQISDLFGDVRSLECSLTKCEKELKALKKDASFLVGRQVRPDGKVDMDSKSESALGKFRPRQTILSSKSGAKSDIVLGKEHVSESRRDLMAAALKASAAKHAPADEGGGNVEGAPTVGELLKAVQTSNDL
jgi:hypothetical protein